MVLKFIFYGFENRHMSVDLKMQNNDLSYTIWRNKGRGLKYCNVVNTVKSTSLLINDGSVI